MKDRLEEKDETGNEKIDKEIVDLVVARLRTMPSDASLSIGGSTSITLEELINDVREQNEIGVSVIEEQLDYLRSLKDLPIDDD